jgi:hypothetical protein
MYFPLCFMVLLKQLRRLYTGGFIFQVPPVYNYSTYCTNRVLTRSVHQVRVYAFSALTTRLRVWCTYKALTNQGEVHQYIDYVVCFNIKDSHHHPKEYTILYVFRALGYDSLVPLSWYKQKVTEVNYKLDLLVKIKIYLV